jgi:predicted site-specific integrase-resolvase
MASNTEENATRPPSRGRTREAVALAQVSKDTLRNWARQGAIPAPTKVGGTLFWDIDAIRKAIDGAKAG